MMAHALLILLAIGIAVGLRPWRCVGAQGPPWAWLLSAGSVALLWSGLPADGLWRRMTGVTLLVLMAGWPLAILAMLAAIGPAAALGAMTTPQALQVLVWLGIVPATCILIAGAAVRRWWPRHLFAYVLGRGVLGSFVASALAGAMILGVVIRPVSIPTADLMVGNLLVAAVEAELCGVVVGTLAVLRPQWLATFSERLYRLP